MIKYRTSGMSAVIMPVEVLRETAKSVYLQYGTFEMRKSKRSDYECYHDTWEDAQNYLLWRVENRIDHLRARRERLGGLWQEIVAMKQPASSSKDPS